MGQSNRNSKIRTKELLSLDMSWQLVTGERLRLAEQVAMSQRELNSARGGERWR